MSALGHKYWKQKRREQSHTIFEKDFFRTLETENVSDVAYVEHPEHHSSQKLDLKLCRNVKKSNFL